jgi:transposase
MDHYEVIRLRCVRDREPIKRVARELGLAPNTVRKYVRDIGAPKPPHYRRRMKLDQFVDVIDTLLRSTPKITAKRIGVVLREQYDAALSISESQLRKVVAGRRRQLVPQEAFVRAHYAPGDQAQFDFSPMSVMIAGVLTIVHVFAMRLSYSGHFFARASLRQDRPSLFAGLLAALRFFGGLPRIALFDNARTAVQKILSGRNREQNTAFRSFCGELALEVEFAAPRRGNEKGGVEGVMGYIEDNLFRPIPSYGSIAELNSDLARLCRSNLAREHSTHRDLISVRFAREQLALRALPDRLPSPCVVEYARVNKFCEVTAETNRYSVPSRYARRDAIVEIFESSVVVVIAGEQVAKHLRGQGKYEIIIDPLHYVELISHKHRSATRALAFANERLPRPLILLRDRMIERDGPSATKAWMAVLLTRNARSASNCSHFTSA